MPIHSRPSNAADLRRRMDDTGIGYAGIDGAWWLPATAPFDLAGTLADELVNFGAAVFALLDTLTELYDANEDVHTLLRHDIPGHIPLLNGGEPVLMVRPDFQLVPTGNGYQPVATEIEICPAAQGFAHAMQVGYGLETDLADHLADFLDGRLLLIVGTAQWSEFLFEQLTLCRALDERGASGSVVYDRPIARIAEDVARSRRWVPPMFGVPNRPAKWNSDVMGRIRDRGLERYLLPGEWPETIGDAVVFRFGYFDCFGLDAVRAFVRWGAAGATFLNPPITYLESKSVLAAARLPVVRKRLAAVDPAIPGVLHHCLPEARLLKPEILPVVLHKREEWIIKYAGFDGDNQAWGGRSLQFGRDHSAASWAATLREAVALPWPVVAQRLTHSAKIDIDYYDGHDRVSHLSGGVTRLRSFLFRDTNQRPHALGSHITVAKDDRVAESTTAVQAPVRFQRR